MSIDLTKLTPLPLRIIHDDGPAFVGNAVGFPVMLSELDNETDLEFFLLARQAIDVMIRRGWTVRKVPEGWGVMQSTILGCDQSPILAHWTGFRDDLTLPALLYHADPFTALVSAEAWYVKNVDGAVPEDEQRRDVPRCPVCSWPLVADAKDGCTVGNCSMRPRPGGDQP